MFLGTLAALIFIPMLIALSVKGMHGRVDPIETDSVLHLDLHGRLVEKARPLDFDFLSRSPFSEDERGTGLFEISKAIRLAKDDKRIEGIYIQLGHLDAGWAMIESLKREIEDFKSSGKFVYAYAESYDEMTFFLASSAEKIFLQPNGDMELNGLEVVSPFLKGLFAKLEVEPRIFRVGKFKAAVEPLILDKMSDENREQNKALIGDVWSLIKTAHESRKLGAEEFDRIATGLEVSSAKQALDAKLVDQLLYEDEVKNLLATKTVGEEEDVKLVTPGQLLYEKPDKKNEGIAKVAVIFAEGEIFSGSGDSDSIGAKAFVETLDDARKDEDVKAIVVRINSPGGDALAADVIWREISITDKEIPVIASMGDVAASGGYYMAAGAREIFAERGTITGSIGVFGIMFDAENLWRNKLGVNFDRVVTHEYSDIGSSTRPMSEFERGRIQSEVERVYNRFVSVVLESRKLEGVDASNFAEGRVWSGVRAKELKLVDNIGGLQDAIKRAADLADLGEKYELEVFPEADEPFERLLELISGETAKLVFGKSQLLQKLRQATESVPFKSGIYARMPFDLRIH